MSYHTDLLRKMELADWPDFERRDFLDELDRLAEEMHAKDSTEGYLASLLIYQQLTEEILKLLVRHSNLLVQCSVFPQEISFKEPNGLMFGQLIGLLESGLLDDEIKKLIKVCKDFNQLRNRIVHRITLKTNVADIRKQARQAKKYYDTIYASYETIVDSYRLALKEYHDNYEDFKT